MLRIKAKYLIIFQIVYCLFVIPWLSYFGVSNIKVVVSDVVNLLLLAPLLQDRELFRSRVKYVHSTYSLVSLFVVMVVIGFFFANPLLSQPVQSVLLAIWNFRILFRPFMFMGLCVFYLDKKTVESLLDVFYGLQFVNIVLILLQYYVLGAWGDHNGGIFSPLQGCNRYSNVYCLIVTAWILLQYMEKKISAKRLVFTFVHLFVVAIYAELKILFVEVILLVAAVVLLSGKNSRKSAIICYGVIASVVGLAILASVFPESFQFLADLEKLLWYAKDMSYSNTEVSVNRLSGFDIINTYMFQGSILKNIVGFGIGMTGSIPFAGIFSAASLQYSTLYYQTFTYSWIFADNGYLGVIMYFLTVMSVFTGIRRIRKKNNESLLLTFSQIASLMVVFLAFYDSSWVTEGTAFLLAFCLAAGFVEYRETGNIPGNCLKTLLN